MLPDAAMCTLYLYQILQIMIQKVFATHHWPLDCDYEEFLFCWDQSGTKKQAELSTNTKRENGRLIRKENTILGEAEYHNRSLMPNITPEARPPPRHGGWWRPMGAVSHRLHARKPSADGGRKLPASWPRAVGSSLPASAAKEATGPNT
jgi:hypothetical protein